MLDKDKDIYLYINSPGGSVTAGLAIYDTMNYIPNECVTIGMGICASMAAFLLSSGQKEKRFALKYTKIMILNHLVELKGKLVILKLWQKK